MLGFALVITSLAFETVMTSPSLDDLLRGFWRARLGDLVENGDRHLIIRNLRIMLCSLAAPYGALGTIGTHVKLVTKPLQESAVGGDLFCIGQLLAHFDVGADGAPTV